MKKKQFLISLFSSSSLALRHFFSPPSSSRTLCTQLSPGRSISLRKRVFLLPAKATTEQSGGGEDVDSNTMPYCSINKAEKKSIGELEQEFLQVMQSFLQSFYYERPHCECCPHNHSQPNSPHNNGVMTMWQQQPCHYPMAPTPYLNGYDHSIEMMPKPMALSSSNVMGTGGGTGVFLPWASVSSRKHVKHLPPRTQKKRLLPLPPPAASPAGESTSEPVISVGGA